MEFLPYLVPSIVSALIGIFSFYLYYRVRKVGFAVIGISFLVGIIPSLVNLALGGSYLPLTPLDRGLDVREIGVFLSTMSFVQMVITVANAVLVSAGLVLLSRDFQTRQ